MRKCSLLLLLPLLFACGYGKNLEGRPKLSLTFGTGFFFILLTNAVTRQLTQSLMTSELPSSKTVENPVSDRYELAFRHSFGFFDDFPDSEWRGHYQEPTLNQLASTPSQNLSTTSVARWLYDNMEPVFVCRHPRKVGNPAGKWMCDPERWTRFFARQEHPASHGDLPCLIYSIGSKGNFRWEEEFVQILGSEDLCEFHIFDPSPVHESAETLQKHVNWHYHSWGLRGLESVRNYTRRRERFLDFHTIRERLGHTDRPINVFKIDCEGCEWESMREWLFSGRYPATLDFPDMHHVLLETHSLPHPTEIRRAGNFGRFLPMPEAEDLQQAFAQHGFILYSKEVNTHQGLGRSVEFGFLRLDNGFFSRS